MMNHEYNEKMAAALQAFGIPTDRVLADPGYEVHDGGITLEPRFFVSFDAMTDEQRAALYAATGLERLR
ncbi:hypothetical protein [Glycomyces arizonensis]|uniref:hypothetical protein n=1 Tax=Glycomyces arizonensis TaxID=256035 RepID=UPI00040D62EE|nr:hypothetical protein [Glycomyces arizonensis]